MGGVDYLPNGDIIGMYADPQMNENAYIGIIDANGDGIPAGVQRVYEFGQPSFGVAVRVSPDGRRVVFGDSTNMNFRLYSMDMASFQVTEISPAGSSFEGAFDLAFIDDGHCYVSANPGSFPAINNSIFHLDIASGELKEIILVNGTFAGPVDVDDGGNLYYVRGQAHFPPQAGDFSVLRFDAAKLSSALGGAPVLGPVNADMVATGLNGGYGVAWHSSGDVFVSDANNGNIYRVTAAGAASDFASLAGDPYEGFNALCMYRREQSFSAGQPSAAEIAVNYLPFSSANPLDTYRITTTGTLPIRSAVNATVLTANSQFILTITAQPTGTPFDAYVVLVGPAGIAYSATPKGIASGIAKYTSSPSGLGTEFKGQVLNVTVPATASRGTWTVYAGMVPAGARPSPASAFALDTIQVIVE
jgi:hypothetical protein